VSLLQANKGLRHWKCSDTRAGPARPGSLRTLEIAGRWSSWKGGGLAAAAHGGQWQGRSAAGEDASGSLLLQKEGCC
jgi:hypothetical protein